MEGLSFASQHSTVADDVNLSPDNYPTSSSTQQFSEQQRVVSTTLGVLARVTNTSYNEFLSSATANNPTTSFTKNFDLFSTQSETVVSVSNFFTTTLTFSSVTTSVFDDGSPTDYDNLWLNSTANGNVSVTSSGQSEDGALSTAVVIFLTIIAAALAIFTAGTNLLVIIAFKSYKRLQTVSNFFLVSLSVADLVIGAVSMPLFTLYLAMGRVWPLGAIVCDVWLSIDYTVRALQYIVADFTIKIINSVLTRVRTLT
jgi:hypothetical protein